MNSEKILIVDDDTKILRILKLQLHHNEYEVVTAETGDEALHLFQEDPSIPLIILDLMLPGIDGISLCKKIKSISPNVKIIILSAKDRSNDIVEGLNSGADDYMKKPFVFDELLARIRANLRKSSAPEQPEHIIEFEDLTLDRNTYEVFRGKHSVSLSKTEFDLLEYLLINHNIVQSREQILDRVWGYYYYGNYNIVDVYIKYLRDKIDRGSKRKLIHTVRGRGYVIK